MCLCLRVAFLPDGSIHVAVACFIEEWCIVCIFACMSKRDQHTEEICFCISAFPCQHSGALDFCISAFPCQHSGALDLPAEALGWLAKSL